MNEEQRATLNRLLKLINVMWDEWLDDDLSSDTVSAVVEQADVVRGALNLHRQTR